jgi:flagellar hook-basal body complex protein FliE
MIDMVRGPSALLQQTKIQNEPTPRSAGKKIATSFQQMFDEVNRDKLHADKMVTEMVAGRNKDIAGTVIAMEKADVSTRMLMAVRNKIVNAYEEIMRMPV